MQPYATRTILIALVACLALPATAQAAPKWIVYEDCSLIPNEFNDGDSFHVKTKSYRYIFRLYFVDTPETSPDVPDRVADQAEYWEIDQEAALRLGKDATKFTERWLRKGFTVYTRKEDAKGRSKRNRYFAMLRVGDEYLSEALVRDGLARVYGWRAELPDGTSVDRYFARLRAAERRARKEGLGGWSRPDLKEKTLSAEQIEGRDVVLGRTATVYSLDKPPRLLGRLAKGSKVRVLGVESLLMVRVRFDRNGEPMEALCRREDLDL